MARLLAWFRVLFQVLVLMLLPMVGQGADKPDPGAVIQELVSRGDALAAAYQPESGLETLDAFSSLYFDVFEASGLENAIGMKDPALKTGVESRFGEVIGLAGQGVPRERLNDAWQALRASLTDQVSALFAEEAMGFTGTVLQAFLILLREGFEAMLVVMALAAYLRRSAGGYGMSALYVGLGLALVASGLSAYGLHVLFEVSGAAREALEGITMLVASAVLLYVSHWLLARRQADRWQAYIRSRVEGALSMGHLWALGGAVFLAVYREGAETILFYYALAGQANGAVLPMLLGGGAAAVVLLGAFVAMRAASLRLPLPLFFSGTAALLFYLAFSFAGTGVLELQEAGWVGITPLPVAPRIPWLGLYPTRETLLAQGLVLLPLIMGAAWLWRQRRLPARA